MLLGWPADVRGELVPGTYTGTVLSYVLATVGISVFTLLLNYVINDLLVPSSLQKAAVDWNKFTKLKDAQRTAAAELIQLVWRRYRKKKRGYKFSKTKEEKYKIDLKAALRINKTMRWKAEKVEQSAKDHHQFSHHHHKDKKEKKTPEQRKRLESYVDTALAEMKEILNETSKLLKKTKESVKEKLNKIDPAENEQELITL